jgi:predicted  nucleic acid-binding Zn-ribbon protein
LIQTIKQLLTLQEIDSAILAATEKKEKGPQEIKELEGELEKSRKEFEEQLEQTENLARKRMSAEQDFEEIRAKIRKSQAKLSYVKNTREHRAILKEIDDLKSMMKAKEEEILQIMEQQEILNGVIEKKKASLENEQVRVEERKRGIEVLIRQAEEDLNVLRDQKAALSKDLNPEILDRYNFIREKLGGLALAGVSNGVCGVCHMNLPPQRFNELLRSDRLMTCPSCHRFIYWSDHEEFNGKVE